MPAVIDGPNSISEPVVSVILPVRNGEDHLGEQLEALIRQDTSEPWELIVVDNGSTDCTDAVISSYRHKLPMTVTRCVQPGRANALNAGISLARGRFIVTLDHDDCADPHYLSAMMAALEISPLVGARLEHESLNPGWPEVLTGQQHNLPEGWMPFSSGAALGVRRSVAQAIGGFRDVSFAEDVDFCWRAQLGGYGLAFAGDAVVHYRHRRSMRAVFRQSRQYGRGSVHLAALFRPLGMPNRTVGDAMASYKSIAALALRARSPAERIRLMVRTGSALGRLEGSVRMRVLHL